MEPSFSNTTVYTKKVLKEAFLNQKRRVKIITLIPFALLAVITILLNVLFQDSGTLTYTIFLIFFVPLMYLVFPIWSASITYKRNSELFHEEVVAKTSFFDDQLISVTLPSNAEIKVNYLQIKRIESSRNLYLIHVKHQLFFIIDKNGFEHVNQFEFEKFMREKATKARIIL